MTPTPRARILLVDDRPENLLALETLLEPLGQQVVRASSGQEALRALLRDEFAVILLDVQMPGLSGFETAEIIKSRDRTRHIPIIFLTAISKDEKFVYQGYSVGAVDYMSKPLQPEILRSKVSAFVELHLKGKQLREQERALREAQKHALELQHEIEMRASEARAADELAAVNEELKRRQGELEHAMSARSRFYASMSHELRTPINAILGYTSLLLDNVYGSLNDKQVNSIERTNRAARHLLELVNDVLDLSKIEAGKIELQLESIGFPALIEDLFVTVRPMADEHGSTLTFAHDGAPINLISDPRRVRQILLNLLSNAIKFGQGEPIHVYSRPAAGGGIDIEVVDQGTGIAQEDQDRIFYEFVQLGRSDRQDGTGLGLPISQRLANLLGGYLTVESCVGAGSTFRLTLPRTVDMLPDGMTLPTPAAEAEPVNATTTGRR